MSRKKYDTPRATTAVPKGPKPIQLSVTMDCTDKTVADLLLELDGIPHHAAIQPYSFSSRFAECRTSSLTFSWEQER